MTDHKDFWNRWAKQYDVIIAKDCKTYARIVQRMKNTLTRDMTVLELACGTGLLSVQITGCVKMIEATDFSEEMIRQAAFWADSKYASWNFPDFVYFINGPLRNI